ncbi:MAG: TatD family hydrolase [Deltaproteobacteria bacterium]|nr:TatD family hydrolase [Deltaproteobacteria bacterium]
MPAAFFDSHCHLNLQAFRDDVDEVLARARAAGVMEMLVVGTEPADSIGALELAHRCPGVYAAIGIHPHDSSSADDSVYARFAALATDEKVVAYGEIGLDFYRDHSPRPVQRREFARQLNLAAELKLPIIVHDREAHQEVYDIIRAEKGYRHGGVIHCFSADYEWAKKFVELGFAISLPGTITYPKSREQQEIARRLSLSDLLIETDAPFLTPVPYRGKRNEPGYVPLVAAAIARAKNLPLDEVAAQTTANCYRVFGLGANIAKENYE